MAVPEAAAVGHPDRAGVPALDDALVNFYPLLMPVTSM